MMSTGLTFGTISALFGLSHGIISAGQYSHLVAAVIGEDGKVLEARVQHSANRELDRKAVEAVKKWKFKPAMKDGRPVKVMITVEVNFRLDPPSSLPASKPATQ